MKYVANPVHVEAHRIVKVGPQTSQPVDLVLDNGETFTASIAMLARMFPVPGDYLVIPEDGCIDLNTKDVFERKYSPAKD